MAKKAAPKPVLELTATNVKVKEYSADAFGTFYRNGYNRPSGRVNHHLAVTGVDAEGKRFWVKFPADVGLGKGNEPLVVPGDVVALTARVSGQSDDGGITFLNYAKLVAVLDRPESADEVDAALDEFATQKAA